MSQVTGHKSQDTSHRSQVKIFSFVEAKALMAGHIDSYQPSKKIVRIEIKIKPIDQLGWLAAQTQDVKVFGANQDDSAAIAGVGEAVGLQGKGRVIFKKIFFQLRSYLVPQYPFLQWYGGFCFDAAAAEDKEWSSFGSWRFVLPRFELARDKERMIFACNLIGRVDKTKVLKELSALQSPVVNGAFNLKVQSRRDVPKPGSWRTNVEKILRDVQAGKCAKVVLARKTVLSFQENLNPWGILQNLKDVTPNSYHFAFAFGKDVFLGASPERLYKRFGRQIVSEALAGTKANSIPAEELLNSTKDQHEHHIVVEAIANQLGPLCQQLDFPKKPGLLSLSNGHHLITKFQGVLKDGIQDEDVLQSLHPTPALGGTPKEYALTTIRGMEPFSRGWYAGPLGYVGLDWAEFVVGIRSGLVKGKKLAVFAGAGIVEGSNPEDEWQEVENKISNFIKIIN